VIAGLFDLEPYPNSVWAPCGNRRGVRGNFRSSYPANFPYVIFSEVRGYKVSLVAARARLEVFAGGTFTARSAQYRHFRYSEVWQAVAT
jgi:hypothetical protein